jgi:hypothetical protein
VAARDLHLDLLADRPEWPKLRPVDFGHDHGAHRRPRGILDQLDDASGVTRLDGQQALAQFAHDLDRGRAALGLVDQVDPELRHLRPRLAAGAAQQPVEIDHPGLADPALVIEDQRVFPQHGADLTHRPVGRFQRRGRGHVQADVEGIFVVLGQHGHLDAKPGLRAADTAGPHKPPRRLQQGQDNSRAPAQQDAPAQAGAMDQRRHHGMVDTVQPVLGLVVFKVMPLAGFEPAVAAAVCGALPQAPRSAASASGAR